MSAGRDTAVGGSEGDARGLDRAWTLGAPLVFVLLWASGFVLAKFITPHADPMTFLSIRFALAAGVLVAIAAATRAPWPSRRQVRDQAIVGLSLHTVYIGGVFVAIDQGLPAGVASLIVGLQPLLSAFVVGPLLGERVAPLQWAGLVLGLVGVALVLESKLHLDGATIGAVALAVVALVGTTGATLYQKRFGSATDLRTGTAVQYVAGSLGCLVVAGAFEEMRFDANGELLGALAGAVLILSVGAITLLMSLIRRGAIARVTSVFYLVPPVTAVYAWLWFDETLGPLALAGIGLAAVGVAAVQRGARGA